jgi:hypothetical protein
MDSDCLWVEVELRGMSKELNDRSQGEQQRVKVGNPNVATLGESYASRLIMVKAVAVGLFDEQHLPLIYPPF